jgi:hypothetical protein
MIYSPFTVLLQSILVTQMEITVLGTAAEKYEEKYLHSSKGIIICK